MATKCPKCQFENPDDTRFCGDCAAPLTGPQGAGISKTITIQQSPKFISKESILGGKYRIIEPIGKGGMGVVYKAEDIKLERTVALKFLPAELTEDPEARERFVREAKAAAALSHNHICTIHEIGEDENQYFIVMECIEGQSLKDRIKKGPLEQAEALDIAIQVAEGLEEAHKKGIIHRDIKSANIMVTGSGQAKVMDFGLAKVFGASLITKDAKTMGTVAYMSPEQAQGEDLDYRTDLWSFGVLLYEMLTGEMPFRGDRESIILHSIVKAEPKPLRELKPDLPAELQRIIDRALKKNPQDRYGSAQEMASDLSGFKKELMAEEIGGVSFRTLLRFLRRPRTLVSTASILILIGLSLVWFLERRAEIKWAREKALPEIKALSFSEEFFWGWNQKSSLDIFDIGKRAARYISKDPEFIRYWPGCYSRVSFETDPPGAQIFAKPYASTYGDWRFLGVSPLESVEMPLAYYRWRIEKEGYEPEVFIAATLQIDRRVTAVKKDVKIFRTLDKTGTVPPGMVHVRDQHLTIAGQEVKISDFYMDKYEVTNNEFKIFVQEGGYKTRDFWKYEFFKAGKRLTWEEAMAEFVDQTGIPGPATWWGGDYQEGKGDFPVTGISWYEAAAYAEFCGKNLPTVHHWEAAQGLQKPWDDVYLHVLIVSESNFSGKGLLPAANDAPMTFSGVCQMGGNVREWCWNETALGRCVRGGGWDDPTYMFLSVSQADPFDRVGKNGVRCIKDVDSQTVPAVVYGPFAEAGEIRDYQKEKPVSDEIFCVYKDRFDYDEKPLDAVVEERDESDENWIKERIVFSGAYTDENVIYDSRRMLAYLFLPKNTSPPYQVVIYFPAAGEFPRTSRSEIEKRDFNRFDFIVKNGRAFMQPIYLGTYERQGKIPLKVSPDSREATQIDVHFVQDCRRSIDYLETRKDINISKLAFFGWSWGARYGRLILAVDNRFKAGVFLAGGLEKSMYKRPEVDAFNFVPRIKIPVLMLSGKYDGVFPYEVSVKPMFDLLGTPQKDKFLKLYDTDHGIPTAEVIKETQVFLDRYLGPVKYPDRNSPGEK